MTTATITISEVQVRALRESLHAARSELAGDEPGDRLDAIDALLAQLSIGAEGDALVLTGARGVLWSAIYDTLCSGAEQLAAACNEIWRGGVKLSEARVLLAVLGDRLDLLEAVGAPERTESMG